MNPQPRYRPGDKIGGRYQVHRALMGGMGEVYLCLDLEEMYPYALKTFQRRYLGDPKKLQAIFEQEVATWVALEKHPNIVRCYWMDILDNQPFMVLEWIAGEEGRGTDLRSWLRRGPLDLRLALDFTIDICRGLSHAQEKQPGIVHRDLKPENILVAQGRLAKITDFGLAQIVQSAELEISRVESGVAGRQSLMGQGGIVGTPPYMAPEQWRGETLDARTDIYAVGCILYEMLTGGWPIQATTLTGFRRQHLEGKIPKVSETNPLLGELDPLLGDCLAKQREERFASVAELSQQLTFIYQQRFAKPPRAAPAPDQFTATDYNNRGATYEKLQHYQVALADYGRAIEMDPTLAPAYSNRGNTYAALQQYQAALHDFSRAIELDPTYAPAYSNRGTTYQELQQCQAALADYGRAIELDPTLAQAYSNRGATYHALQQYQAALADYERAIELDPTYAQAYYNRGLTYAALQQYQAALHDFSRTTELDPNLASAYSNRGMTYHELQQYPAALRDYGRAIELDPNFAQAYYNRGLTYNELQQYQAALHDFSRAIELDPNHAQAYAGIGLLFAVQGNMGEALRYLDKVAQIGDPQAKQGVAQIRQMLGMEAAPQVDPAQLAFEAFQQADSLEAMRQAVAHFPLLAQADFIAAIQQAIAQQVPPEHRPTFKQRLVWLRQIAEEQQQKE
jgi:serine/threonine protein kinase/Tfp pilus assembly protein PilF